MSVSCVMKEMGISTKILTNRAQEDICYQMLVPQKAMFDIKTRSSRKKGDDVLAGEIDRLWLRQMPNFILAYHQRGVFDDIAVINVTKLIAKWEADHVDEIRIFS